MRCHVSQSSSWGILDQDNTSCLFWGIPDLEDQDMVPLEPMDAVTLIMYLFASLFGLQYIQMVVMAIRLFYSSVTNVIVWDLYCLVDLVVKECLFRIVFAKICIYIDLWELWFIRKLLDWYGQRPFTISIILYFVTIFCLEILRNLWIYSVF